jgi:hypothetical protein
MSRGDLLNFRVITIVLISHLIRATKASSDKGNLPNQSSFLKLQIWYIAAAKLSLQRVVCNPLPLRLQDQITMSS